MAAERDQRSTDPGLPEIPHAHDRAWYRSIVASLPPELKTRATDGYRRVFVDVWNDNAGKIDQSNAARREANTRLRKFVERYGTQQIFD